MKPEQHFCGFVSECCLSESLTSSPSIRDSGVPQGSVLGSLFFWVYQKNNNHVFSRDYLSVKTFVTTCLLGSKGRVVYEHELTLSLFQRWAPVNASVSTVWLLVTFSLWNLEFIWVFSSCRQRAGMEQLWASLQLTFLIFVVSHANGGIRRRFSWNRCSFMFHY